MRDVSRLPKSESSDFSAFWETYPKKVGKAHAQKAFAKLKVDDRLLDLMLAAIKAQAKTEAWTKNAGMFIPHPATWLNGRRWEDEPCIQVAPDETKPAWALRAGFANRFDAENAGCSQRTASLFSEGRRMEIA